MIMMINYFQEFKYLIINHISLIIRNFQALKDQLPILLFIILIHIIQCSSKETLNSPNRHVKSNINDKFSKLFFLLESHVSQLNLNSSKQTFNRTELWCIGWKKEHFNLTICHYLVNLAGLMCAQIIQNKNNFLISISFLRNIDKILKISSEEFLCRSTFINELDIFNTTSTHRCYRSKIVRRVLC